MSDYLSFGEALVILFGRELTDAQVGDFFRNHSSAELDLVFFYAKQKLKMGVERG